MTGTEGPGHDPYSFTEFWFYEKRNGHERSIVLHLGLGAWLRFNTRTFTILNFREVAEKRLEAKFAKLTGLTAERLERYYYQRLHYDDPMGSLRDYE